jgi:hypothetical protein
MRFVENDAIPLDLKQHASLSLELAFIGIDIAAKSFL